MTNPQRVMLLIDADNVSTDVVEQAISRLHAEYGALHVRRAYGTAENAVKHQKLFKRLSIKPMVNLAAGKNSTDIALAVDAIDLVLSERPDVVVIASSDSDFAPLVGRIREKGCLVRGIGQKGKVGEETPLIYDDFIEFEHRASRRHAAAPAAAPAARTGRSRARKSAQAVEEGGGAAATSAGSSSAASAAASRAQSAVESPAASAAPKSPAAKSRARKTSGARSAAAPAAPEPDASTKPARKRTPRASAKAAPSAKSVGSPAEATASRDAGDAIAAPARRTARKRASAPAPAPAPSPPMPEKVARAFEVLPALAAGERLDVQNAAAVLRKERVFSNADSWPKFFERYKDWFDLTPRGRPTHVQRRAPT